MQTSSFTTLDNLKIHTVNWLPPNKPSAGVVLVHGYGEHIGRYTHVAEALVNGGYAVFGLDHRGHGKSAGLQAYFENIEQPVKDLAQYFEQIQQQHPGMKLFMLGHSMGSLLALAFALKYPTELTGLLLSGCAVNGDETVPSPILALANILKNIIPTTPLIPGLPPTELSTDTAVVAAYQQDPLVYTGAWRVGMGALLINTGKILREQANQLALPLLVLHGAEDKITPVSGSKLIYERAASTDKTLKLYPGMRHEIMNEREKERVLTDILAWLNNH
jgi:alpha-beta hydrolase superfamily lysophospholipase